MPDPERVGGLAWTRRTRGALTGAERRRLLVAIARGQAENAAGQIKHRLGRAPRGAGEMPDPPDSAFARDVQEACDDQPAAIRAHSYRTWAFGWALAALDGQSRSLDPEAFWCAALLHDSGLTEEVAGEDFTLRSAEAAMAFADRHGRDDGFWIGDAITVHATPGATAERDGAPGAYIAAGALLDLGRLRLWDVSPRLLDHVAERWVPGDMVPYVRGEGRAVPRGRFALLVRCGGTAAMRLGALRR
jgi:predicted HD phosphohydrolase